MRTLSIAAAARLAATRSAGMRPPWIRVLTDLNLETANDPSQHGQGQRDRDLRKTRVAVMADWNGIGNGGHDGLQVFHDNRIAAQDGPAVGTTGRQLERRQCGSVDLFALGPGVNAASLTPIGVEQRHEQQTAARELLAVTSVAPEKHSAGPSPSPGPGRDGRGRHDQGPPATSSQEEKLPASITKFSRVLDCRILAPSEYRPTG
jgi:hypothetical protein